MTATEAPATQPAAAASPPPAAGAPEPSSGAAPAGLPEAQSGSLRGTVKDVLWIDPTVYYAGGPATERTEGSGDAAASEGSPPAPVDAASPSPTASPPSTPSTSAPPATPEPSRVAASLPPAPPPPITEADVERRIQAALEAARARDRDRLAADAAAVERTKVRELWRQWKIEGNTEAGTQVLEILGAPLDQETTVEAVRPHVDAAVQATQSTIWRQHIGSFGLDPADAELRQIADFKALNAALLKRATDDAAVQAAWENPKVQARHLTELTTALQAAKEAAYNNGVATVIGSRVGPDVSGVPAGRPETLEEIERAWADNPDDPVLLDKYRRIVRPARGYR